MKYKDGFFDDGPDSEDAPLRPKSALFLAALTAIAADGRFVNAETCDLEKIVRGDQATFDLAYKTFKNTPYEDCVDLVACSLNENQKTALIAILLDLVMADGVLADAEKNLVSLYVAKFGIPADIFRDLCHYISLKNNFALFD